MRYLTAFLLVLLILNISYSKKVEKSDTKKVEKAKVEIPEVVFPVEVITEKKEEKPPVYPPKKISYDVKFQIKEEFEKDIKPIPPVDIEPIEVYIEKPSTFLGLPKDNALLGDAIEFYNTNDYLLADEKLKTLFKEYKESKNFGTAYYLRGLIKYKTGDTKEALKNFEKACFYKGKLEKKQRKASCISAVILAYQTGNPQKAREIASRLKNKRIDELFIKVINYTMNGDYDKALKVSTLFRCEQVHVNLIEYCRYTKGYLYFFKGNYRKALGYFRKVKDKKYKQQITVLKGFAYLKLGKLDEAERVFRNYLKVYGTLDNISTYVFYGLGLIDLKKGLYKKALRIAGTLEARDKRLAQNIYMTLADRYSDKHNFKMAFSLLQKSLKISSRYKDVLKKKISITAYNEGHYEYAYKLMKGIKNPYFYLFMGYSLYWLGKYDEATKYLDMAVKDNIPRGYKYEALKLLADIYYRSKREKKFLDIVRKIKDYNKKTARDLLGWFFFKKKDYAKAYKVFVNPYMKAVSAFNSGNYEPALQLIHKINNRKAKFLEAYIYLRKGEFDVARDILRNLAKYRDEIGEQSAYLYAFSFFAQGDYQTAAEEFENFLRVSRNPKFRKQAQLRLADCYYNLGKKDIARRIYETFIKNNANSPEAIDAAYQLTLLEMNSSEVDVEKQIKRFLRKYPRYKLADLLRTQLADLYIEKKNYAEAEKIFLYLIKKNVRESEYALYKLGYLKYKTGNTDEAKQILIAYLQKYPNGRFKKDTLNLLAKMYEEEHNYREAIKYVRQLPQTNQNKYRLAMLYFHLGNYSYAKKYFENLYKTYPEYKSEIGYYLGKIAYIRKDLKTALRYFEEATNSSDYDIAAESYFYLGEIYRNLGKPEMALNNYLNVIYLYPEAKVFVSKARVRVAESMFKQDKRMEASCMLKPVDTKYLNNIELRLYDKLKKKLPTCYN